MVYSVRCIISWKTGNIVTFTHIEEGNLVQNERNTEEDEPILASIDDPYTDDDYDDRSISTDTLEEIQDGSQIHPEINTRDARLKIFYHIKQTKSE